MNVRYRVTLSTPERVQLVRMVLGGKLAVRKLKRVQILLAADAGSTDEQIAKNVVVGTSTVYRTKQRFLIAFVVVIRPRTLPATDRSG
ncbi:MAG: helix-turn-helix domain-containing protein [Deltaproteobacteria bacterium]|nr:helix-turn-helix domain-containing protein [Deltaproteobacteria bacterium]